MDFVDETIQTYNKIAHKYCEKTRQDKFLKWEEEFIKIMLSFIPMPNPLVLDVGCADGRHCVIFDKHGARTIGVDLSENMLDEARALFPPGDFKKMDMRNLLLEDDSVDGVWSSGSIYHVTRTDAGKVVEEFRRVLKPDGVAAVNFKLGTGEGLEQNPKSYGGSPRYFAYYSEQDMEDLFKGSGFETLDSKPYPEEIFGDDVRQMWFRLSR